MVMEKERKTLLMAKMMDALVDGDDDDDDRKMKVACTMRVRTHTLRHK